MRSDKNHPAARRFLKQLLKGPASLLLHEWVFVEAMTLLKVRGGSGVAIRAGEEIKRNPLYRWQVSTPQLEQLAWGIFERYTDKDWSYTDCALLALSRQMKTSEIWTYDQNLRQATLWKVVGR
jgi:predicted nucleic acid-binding protein